MFLNGFFMDTKITRCCVSHMMKLTQTLSIVFLFTVTSLPAFAGKKTAPVFYLPDSAAVHRSFDKLFDTLTIRPHERIADVGAQGGNIIPYLNYKYDSLEVHLEDISAQWLKQARVDTVVAFYNRVLGHTSHNQYTITIGNDTATTLPAGYFNKVFFFNTYHECSRKADMVRELNRICAPGGMVILVETVGRHPGKTRKDCHHIMPTDAEIAQVFGANGFTLSGVHYIRKGSGSRQTMYRYVKK